MTASIVNIILCMPWDSFRAGYEELLSGDMEIGLSEVHFMQYLLVT